MTTGDLSVCGVGGLVGDVAFGLSISLREVSITKEATTNTTTLPNVKSKVVAIWATIC